MKLFLKYLVFLILMIQFHQTIAQSLSSNSKKAIKFYKEAESFYRQQDYKYAEDALNKALKKDENFKEAMLLLGDILRDQNKLIPAINIYKKLLLTDSLFYPKTYYFLANLYLEIENYEQAVFTYDLYLKVPDKSIIESSHAEAAYKKAVFIKNAIENPMDVEIKRLDFPLNSNNEEYINYVSPSEDYMVFTRKDYGDLGVASSYFREYFMESKKLNERWDNPAEVHLPNAKGNTGGMSLTFDGKKMFFTGCNWSNNHGSCDIYFSKKQSGEWSEVTLMGLGINSNAWDSQASVSADGNTMYFSSKRKGGKGGSDIWKSEKLENGQWSPAINLGDSINSAANEMAPYIHPDGKTLYYSSDRFMGIGGYDLFISRKDITNQWTKGRNMGYPINTKYDEINIFPAMDGKKAWISSNRNADSTVYDIYSLKLNNLNKPQKIIFFAGKVIDKITKSPLNSIVQITDLKNGKIFSNSESDEGDGSFISVLYPHRNYAFNITKEGYLLYSSSLYFDKEEVNYNRVFELSRIEKGLSVSLHNVYFDTNKWNLKSESYPELNKVFLLMKDNPKLKFLIEGHTDNTGTEKNNLELSEKRANAVKDYLISKGISGERLSHVGRGSEFPIADNNDEKGRSLNRRTTIIVK